MGLQPAGSSSTPDLAAASAAATGGPSSSRSSGDATSSKQRRATDYLCEWQHSNRQPMPCVTSQLGGIKYCAWHCLAMLVRTYVSWG